ncbi:Glycosyltransferase, catalytic subunit of cellulose synthase and poly-beta-1,6-N-acetylglucosamine synthase [Bradyrhizobium lablabi]|uniref:Glycosyltransferase, catalytic subunit of cellulose synthase and poly-beta-1,6-N-acetylglucosamine synthase n=1 Tax=Bradyrhizobium lablabi TaxID=722472 RepID=A0A1M6MQ54_9BRAD|nr:glycosyltransferase family 2 protein [Bradyrhizobium lablabi]SHJ85572.1 Glycosyltransferase, catalytic subunit of cellulose synthase and poly-beta-1,6-N-acetylglucosamine synthase [Bradyrhizobium lablabi]
MYPLLTAVAVICVSIVTLQLIFLAIQVGGSLLPDNGVGEDATHQANCAVVMPAHNERGGIAHAIKAIQSQLNPTDRLIVVADNCSDETAQIAASAGAETIERTDQVHVGKGYALDFGIKYIESGAVPDVIIFMDSDCIAAPGCVSRLVNLVTGSGRPVQGRYLIHASIQTAAARAAEFTYKIKGAVRPGGGARFGIPCMLMGTAMALPWNLIRRSNLATGSITEDLRLAIELSLQGFPTLFCSNARCDSDFPESESGMATQQTRWQHGYFSSLVEYAPKLFLKALSSADFRLLALAIDFSIPPLGLMLAITALMSGLASVAILVGAGGVLAKIAITFFPAFVLLILLTWFFHGRDIVSGRDLLLSFKQVMKTISMLWSFITRPQQKWVRTERREDNSG